MAPCVRFGDFEADLGSGELRRSGLKVQLPDQSFRVLALLLENAGRLVTRDQLREKLWSRHRLVDFEAGLNSAIKRLRDSLHDSAGQPRYIETLPRRGYRFVESVSTFPPAAPARIESLAVLPLANLTGDQRQEYFVDGMTDALITRLAQISALRVISRTSVMQYKNARAPLPEIAGRLGVDAVIEGAVSRSGSRVRITAQLVHAPTDRHLWAREYERDVTDVLLLQAEVARAIVDEIRVALTPQEQARLASGRFVKPAAYEAYLRGRLHWNKRSEPGMRKGLELFEQACEQDPSFALSHAGVAESYNMLAYWGVVAPGPAAARAKAAALRALEMDGVAAEAHAALGWALFSGDWEWDAGERALQRAIALNPGYTVAHQWYSHLLAYRGRFVEALAEIQRTLELDPLSLIMNSSAAFICVLARRPAEAERHARRTIELDAHLAAPYLWLAWALQAGDAHAPAIEALRQAAQLSGDSPRYLASLGHGLAIAGQRAEAEQLLVTLDRLAAQRYVAAYDFALLHIGLGQRMEALAALERACEERSPCLALLPGDTRFDALRAEPRTLAVLKRLGATPT